ncbi:MAG: GNAT family N-acetyltransferase [Sandaracinaceae bacterium]|nr:GNAT family N-acetyltransferase [Sandaracinaceae bacterium]
MAYRPVPELQTERLLLTVPRPAAAAKFVAFFEDNRVRFDPWDPPRPEGFYTAAWWEARITQDHDEFQSERAVRLVMHDKNEPNGPIVGHCHFTQMARGPFQACILGYAIDHRYAGQGLMYEGARAALRHVFDAMGFHRVMANYAPTNERSGRLLRRLGFTVEGYARDYLYINGAWRDHVLTALTNPSAEPPLTR